jgi:thiol:disulfide interchange protein
MKSSFKPLIVVFIAVVVMGIFIYPHGSTKGIIPWRTDLAAARAEAKASHKRLFIEFSAGWCGPCQQMARDTWSDKNVAAELEKMVPVQVDVDSHADLVTQFGVRPIPAYFVLDAGGNHLNYGEGYRGPEEFLAWLRGSAGNADPTPR